MITKAQSNTVGAEIRFKTFAIWHLGLFPIVERQLINSLTTNRQSAIDNWQCYEPPATRAVVLTPLSLKVVIRNAINTGIRAASYLASQPAAHGIFSEDFYIAFCVAPMLRFSGSPTQPTKPTQLIKKLCAGESAKRQLGNSEPSPRVSFKIYQLGFFDIDDSGPARTNNIALRNVYWQVEFSFVQDRQSFLIELFIVVA